MTELLPAAQEIQNFCELQKWSFCFIGGVAVQYWGEARFTKDVDLTLLTGFGEEERFVDALLAQYRGRTSGSREFALRNRVLLLTTVDGIPIDIALGALPFEQSAVNRARKVECAPGYFLNLCSAEDLLVFKTFAGRAIDLQDVKMIIARQGDSNLDWKYIFQHLGPLAALKEQPEIIRDLEKLRQEVKEILSRPRIT